MRRIVQFVLVEFLAVAEIFELTLWGGFTWLFRDHGIFGPNSPEVTADQTRLAIGITVLLVLNVVAFTAFELRPWLFGWWLLATVQIVNVIAFAGLITWIVRPSDSFSIEVFTASALASAVVAACTVALKRPIPSATQ